MLSRPFSVLCSKSIEVPHYLQRFQAFSFQGAATAVVAAFMSKHHIATKTNSFLQLMLSLLMIGGNV